MDYGSIFGKIGFKKEINIGIKNTDYSVFFIAHTYRLPFGVIHDLLRINLLYIMK